MRNPGNTIAARIQLDNPIICFDSNPPQLSDMPETSEAKTRRTVIFPVAKLKHAKGSSAARSYF